jgi:hypothetical protein
VAIVNDEVILLSEFKKAFQAAVNSGTKKTKREILNEMINRILLLEEAKRFRLGDSVLSQETPERNDMIINEYIERRIKAFIRIPFEELESYYLKNKELFGNKEFYEVRNEIEESLIKEKLNKKLLEHIKELRKKSYVRIQLEME